MGMKVSFGLILFSIDLVGKGAIELIRNGNIQKWKRDMISDFQSKLNVGAMLLRWLKK
jgi:hypothetical protein